MSRLVDVVEVASFDYQQFVLTTSWNTKLTVTFLGLSLEVIPVDEDEFEEEYDLKRQMQCINIHRTPHIEDENGSRHGRY